MPPPDSTKRGPMSVPLPVAQSLIEHSDKPISWFFREWKNVPSINDERSVVECVFPPGMYSVPPADEIRAYEQEFVRSAVNADEDSAYITARRRRQIERARPYEYATGLFGINTGVRHEDWFDQDLTARELSVEELTSLCFWNRSLLSSTNNERGIELRFGRHSPSNFPVFSPAHLCEAAIRFDKTTRFSIQADDEVTVGELAHLCSRFNEPFNIPRIIECTDTNDEFGAAARERLRPLVGDAWMSFIAFAHYLPGFKFGPGEDMRSRIDLAERYAATGFSIDELNANRDVAYNIDVIEQLSKNGIAADMFRSVNFVR